jgi:dihydroorotate dehydrogenase electron transfer subunit
VKINRAQQVATARDGPVFSASNAALIDRTLGVGYARVSLGGIPDAEIARPGQFLMIRRLGSAALPRAFSVIGAEGDRVELFLKLDGLLRELLGSVPLGTRFELRGPYGVPYEDRISPGRQYVLVGGGSGAAPLLFLHAQRPDLVADVVLGFRHDGATRLLDRYDLVIESVDGRRALDRLSEVWRAGHGIVACGPEPMLRAIGADFGDQPDVYVSLEARLGCGIGSCLGCSIPTISGTRRICRDGPLFACSEIPWLR